MNIDVGYNQAVAHTKSDTVNAAFPFDAIYVGGVGDVVVVLPSGVTALFEAVPAGTVLPIAGIRINSTNTTGSKFAVMRRF